VVVHLALLLPLGWLLYLGFTGQLGTDPAQRVVRHLGFSGACILWLCLAMTPLRRLTGEPGWIGFRRALGLWAFAYLSLHLLAFVVVWAGLDLAIILEELTKRPYMYVGLVGWLLMVPLAVTSTRSARRRLGRRWQQLHRLIYPVALLGLLHMIWLAKLDYLQPALFGVALLLLLVSRRLAITK